MRQLEPVIQMWAKDYDVMDHTPGGRDPLCPAVLVLGKPKPKWYRQENECPACMLARIGSDKDVVFALLAGMIGSYGSHSVGKNSKIKSRRIRWARYWLKQFPGGDKLVDEAWDLGNELRRLHKAWEAHVRQGERKGFYGTVRSPATPVTPVPVPGHASAIGIDISGDFHPGHQGDREHDRRLTQILASREDYTSPFQGKVNDAPNEDARSEVQGATIPRRPVDPRIQSVRWGESGLGQAPSVRSQQASVATHTSRSTHASQWSWESGVSTPRVMSRIGARPAPLNVNKDSKRDSAVGSQTPRAQSIQPTASRRSMYSGFGRAAHDSQLYDGYDVSPPSSPVLAPVDDDDRTPLVGHTPDRSNNDRASRQTNWSSMY